jgi:hypothetical protein
VPANETPNSGQSVGRSAATSSAWRSPRAQLPKLSQGHAGEQEQHQRRTAEVDGADHAAIPYSIGDRSDGVASIFRACSRTRATATGPSVQFSPFGAYGGARTSHRNQVLARWRAEARDASLGLLATLEEDTNARNDRLRGRRHRGGTPGA